jgi:uncharacterized membrane protein AbrB (regulator of aidB expression)
MKTTAFWGIAPCSLADIHLIALKMEAADTSDTSVNLYQTTRRSIPKESRLEAASKPAQLN